MDNEKEKLLDEISKKYEIDPKYLKLLINIEKDYANKNQARRTGIFKEMKEIIEVWTMV